MKRLGSLGAFVALLLIATGAVLSMLTIQVHVKDLLGVPGESWYCNINAAFNCGKVMRSAIATLWGIPLGAFGLAYYMAFAALLPSPFRKSDPVVPCTALFFYAGLGFLVSIGLFIYSEVHIGALCPLCLGTYVVNLLLFVVFFFSVGIGKIGAFFEGGVELLGTFPKRVLGRRGGGPHLVRGARLAALAIVLFTAFSLTLPERLLYSWMENAVPDDEGRRLAADFAKWTAAKEDNLGVNNPGGTSGDFATGPVGAPVQLVEFSDFECPACRMFYPRLEEVMKHYEGKIRVVYRNYPLDTICNPAVPRPMHLTACYAASFARCAGEQGKFWETADYLLTEAYEIDDESAEALLQSIEKAITRVGLDGEAMKECLASGRQGQRVNEDVAKGTALGIRGTPSVWINKKRVPSFDPVLLEKILEHIISGK